MADGRVSIVSSYLRFPLCPVHGPGRLRTPVGRITSPARRRGPFGDRGARRTRPADPAGFATAFEIAGDGSLLAHDSRRSQPLTVARREKEGAPGGVALPSSPLAPQDDPYYRQIAAFAKSVLDGAPLVVTPEDARSAVAVAVAALESVRTGEAVAL